MSRSATHSNREGHRYNWCPGCDELWGAGWMAAARVDRCPRCDGRLLPYVGRSPYDVAPPWADDTPSRAVRAQAPAPHGLAPSFRRSA